MSQAVELAAQQALQKGSKTFSLAARILRPKVRVGVALLYSWCRFCDDLIDLPNAIPLESRLQLLKSWTELAYQASLPIPPEAPIEVQSLRYVVTQFQIPKDYLLQLIAGMAMDVRGDTYETFDDLVIYTYRVAGVVGLMMSHILGVSDPLAYQHATDLGHGFQLSNILRDVLEDAQMGRVYLPLEWLREFKIPVQDLQDPKHRLHLAQVCRRLSDRADVFYASADLGLQYLSFWTAVTICAARKMYTEIGKIVIRRGPHAWDQRAYVPLRRKLWLCSAAFFTVLKQRIFRSL